MGVINRTRKIHIACLCLILAIILSAGETSFVSNHKNTGKASSARLNVIIDYKGLDDAALVRTTPVKIPSAIRLTKRAKGNPGTLTGLFCICLCVYSLIYLSIGKIENNPQCYNFIFSNKSIILYIHNTDGQKDNLLFFRE